MGVGVIEGLVYHGTCAHTFFGGFITRRYGNHRSMAVMLRCRLAEEGLCGLKVESTHARSRRPWSRNRYLRKDSISWYQIEQILDTGRDPRNKHERFCSGWCQEWLAAQGKRALLLVARSATSAFYWQRATLTQWWLFEYVVSAL